MAIEAPYSVASDDCASAALHATLLLIAIDAPPGEQLLPRLAIYLLIAFLLSLGRTMRRARVAPAVDAAPISANEVATV